MSTKALICVICPNGCELLANLEQGPTLKVLEVTGHLCEKGPNWAEQEILSPVRTISSSILVEAGDFPLASVRTDSAIPLQAIFEVMKAIKTVTVKAPVKIGQVIIEKPAGTSCNIIATRNVQKLERSAQLKMR